MRSPSAYRLAVPDLAINIVRIVRADRLKEPANSHVNHGNEAYFVPFPYYCNLLSFP